MISRTGKVRLGVFLILSTALVITVFVVLAGVRVMASTDVYQAKFDESVSGLEIGAQVKYNGVRVGRVSEIKINPGNLERVTVFLELEEGTPVKVDVRAVLVGMGITGLKFVELTGGTNDAPLLEPGSTIKAGHSFMGTIEGRAKDIALKTELALNKVNLVLSEHNIARIQSILENIDGVTEKADTLVEDNEKIVGGILKDLSVSSYDLKTGIASAKRVSGEIEKILGTSKPKVQSILDNVNRTTSTIRRTARSLSKVDGILSEIQITLGDVNRQLKEADVGGLISDTRDTVQEAENAIRSVRQIVDSSRENVYSSTVSLKNTLRNLEEVSADVRNQPSLLLNSDPLEERTPPDEKKWRRER